MSAPRCRICDKVLSTTSHPPSGQERDCPAADDRPDPSTSGEERGMVCERCQKVFATSEAATICPGCRGAAPTDPEPETKQGWRDNWGLANSLDIFADRLVLLNLVDEDQADLRSIREAARRLKGEGTERYEGAAFMEGDNYCRHGDQPSWVFVPECEHESADEMVSRDGSDRRATLLVRRPREEPTDTNTGEHDG